MKENVLLFLGEEAVTLLEPELKSAGKEFLPGVIKGLQNALNNFGKLNVWQFKKEAEKEGVRLLLVAAQDGLDWCNS